MNLPKSPFPVCEKCGIPIVPDITHSLTLYFKNREEAEEFKQQVEHFNPQLEEYTYESK